MPGTGNNLKPTGFGLQIDRQTLELFIEDVGFSLMKLEVNIEGYRMLAI